METLRTTTADRDAEDTADWILGHAATGYTVLVCTPLRIWPIDRRTNSPTRVLSPH